MPNLEDQRRVAMETADKYLESLSRSKNFDDRLSEFIKATFCAGFSSGVRWIILDDESTPVDRKGEL